MISMYPGSGRWLAAALSMLVATGALAENEVTPAIPGVVAGGVEIVLLQDGFTGTEGPIAWSDGSVLFTETQAKRITRISADGTVSTFLPDSNGANGLALGTGGELYAVQTASPRVGIVYPPNKVKVLAEKFEGELLNRPNDLVLDKRGGVYFTDPGVAPKPNEPVTTKPAVYYIKPDGQLTRVITDIARPNGIQLSPDGTVLYVANTAGEYVYAYDVAEDGSLGPQRKFALLEGFRKTETGPSSGADGLAIDAKGRLYVATTIGIQVFSDFGIALGVIPLPKAPQNLAFAGPDKSYLYVVGRGAAYRFPVLTPGFAGRAK